MDNAEKIEYLRNYRFLIMRIAYLDSSLYGARPIQYNKLIDVVIEKNSTISDLNDRSCLLNEAKRIKVLIDSQKSLAHRMILHYVYIEGLSLQYICDKNLMGYSYRQLRRLHNEAINELVIA